MERRGAEPLGHSLRAQPAEGEGRQTDQHHLGEVLGDQGGLADTKGHQYAHLLTAVVHPQQQHETEHEHGRDGHADQAPRIMERTPRAACSMLDEYWSLRVI